MMNSSNVTAIEKFVEKIANEIRTATLNMKKIEEREAKVDDIMNEYNIRYEFLGDVPAKGANGSIKKMKASYRIQYRCGYSKHNYAPSIEIENRYLTTNF